MAIRVASSPARAGRRKRIEYVNVAIAAWLRAWPVSRPACSSRCRGTACRHAAMLVGLQPIVTVFLARVWLGEPVIARQWAGPDARPRRRVAGRAPQGSRSTPTRSRSRRLPSRSWASSVGTLVAEAPRLRTSTCATGAVIQFRRLRDRLSPALRSRSSRSGTCAGRPTSWFALGWSVGRAVGRRDQPALLAAAARGRRGGGAPVLPRAARHRGDGLRDVRRASRRGGDRRHGG